MGTLSNAPAAQLARLKVKFPAFTIETAGQPVVYTARQGGRVVATSKTLAGPEAALTSAVSRGGDIAGRRPAS
jgi:hypothetical protein